MFGHLSLILLYILRVEVVMHIFLCDILTGDRDKVLHLLDRKLLSTLQDVRLVYLLEREGGWDTITNWEDMLSLGEQQRFGMVCVFQVFDVDTCTFVHCIK